MKAEVSVNGETTPEIEVNNALRQGCTIVPMLINLFFNPTFWSGHTVQVWWKTHWQENPESIIIHCNRAPIC